MCDRILFLIFLASYVTLLLGQAFPPPIEPEPVVLTTSQSLQSNIQKFLNKATQKIGMKQILKRDAAVEKAKPKPDASKYSAFESSFFVLFGVTIFSVVFYKKRSYAEQKKAAQELRNKNRK